MAVKAGSLKGFHPFNNPLPLFLEGEGDTGGEDDKDDEDSDRSHPEGKG